MRNAYHNENEAGNAPSQPGMPAQVWEFFTRPTYYTKRYT